jgi:hypothetical protein
VASTLTNGTGAQPVCVPGEYIALDDPNAACPAGQFALQPGFTRSTLSHGYGNLLTGLDHHAQKGRCDIELASGCDRMDPADNKRSGACDALLW